MSFTLSVGSDGTATTAQVVWSVNGQTYLFRSDNNFLSWITTIFEVADTLSGGGGLDLIYSDQIPPVDGGVGNLWAKYSVGASVAGNARGVGAVDLQQIRANATQVSSAPGSVVGGGRNNTASNNYATVGGGYANIASYPFATVGGGQNNTASGYRATVGGGGSNTASNSYATVGGGGNNTASNNYATVGGGYNNTVAGYRATIGGGSSNIASNDSATVGGGRGNTASNSYATVGGGDSNTASGYYATVGGGKSNAASLDYATVGGGINNNASGDYATVGGGYSNTASGDYATVGGGYSNTASGDYATVGGGWNALADRYGQTANASGQFASQGDAQAVSFVMRGTTSGASTTNLKLDGSTINLTIPVGKILSGIINIAGVDSAGVQTLQHTTQFFIQNVGGVTTLVHQAVVGANHKSNPAISAVISADNVNDCLQVACTGLVGTTMRWVAVVNGLEIGIS